MRVVLSLLLFILMHLRSIANPLIAICLLLLMMTSCCLWKGYIPPSVVTPPNWKNNEGTGVSLPEDWKESDQNATSHEKDPCLLSEECLKASVVEDLENWWEIFQDPILNMLEEQAIANSYTLWAAFERVLQARYQAQISWGARLPAITLDPSFSRSGMLIENPLGTLGGNGAGGTNVFLDPHSVSSSPSFSSLTRRNLLNNQNNMNNQMAQTGAKNLFRSRQSEYLLPIDLSYEVDLWGKLLNAYQAAAIREQAAYEDYLNVLLRLTGDVAVNYFRLRGYDAEKVVLEKTIKSRRETLEINQERFKAGLIIYSDVTRAQVELYRAEADSSDVARLRALQEDIIATLVGVPAPIFSLKFNPLTSDAKPPSIPTGLPSELLQRRPDIATAERNLAAAFEDIGVAYTDFFPSLNLMASLGFESPRLSNLLSWQARYWRIAASIMQIIYDAGRTEANFRYYKSRYYEAMANYEQQVLIAFQDVEDALANLRLHTEQIFNLRKATVAAQETTKLSRIRYNQGLTTYLEVVDAERDALTTESNLTQIIYQRYVDTVLLIRALGGGWGNLSGAEDCEACYCD